MLTGAHPFDINCDRSDDEVANAIKQNPYPPLDDLYVGHLSESAVDVIKKLMEPDPAKRMTAYELLHHPWVQGETATTEKIEDSDKKLSHFQDLRHKLEASIFAVLVNQGHQVNFWLLSLSMPSWNVASRFLSFYSLGHDNERSKEEKLRCYQE